MDKLLQWKLVILGVLVTLSTIALALPYWIYEKRKGRRLNGSVPSMLSILNAFSGGVIVAAGLVHLLPESREEFDSYFGSSDEHFPYAETVVGGIVLLLYATEKMHEAYSSSDVQSAVPLRRRMPKNDADSSSVDGGCITPTSMTSDAPLLSAGNDSYDQQLGETPTVYGSMNAAHAARGSKSVLSARLFAMALSLHSIFEGLGLGSLDSVESLTVLIVAVGTHKFLAAFALGISFVNARSESHGSGPVLRKRRWFRSEWVLHAIGFLVATPIGMAIGMVLNNTEGEALSLTQGICLSLASGSLCFVGLLAILPREWTMSPHTDDVVFSMDDSTDFPGGTTSTRAEGTSAHFVPVTLPASNSSAVLDEDVSAAASRGMVSADTAGIHMPSSRIGTAVKRRRVVWNIVAAWIGYTGMACLAIWV